VYALGTHALIIEIKINNHQRKEEILRKPAAAWFLSGLKELNS